MKALAEWLSRHQFPCFTKQVFGLNCPFCGFQRSVIALLKGDIYESVTLFPALIPLILTFIAFGCFKTFKIPSLKKVIIGMLIADFCIMILNCIYQNIQLFL